VDFTPGQFKMMIVSLVPCCLSACGGDPVQVYPPPDYCPLAGGAWGSHDDGLPPRTYTFGRGGFKVDDSVATCPKGAECVGAGIVTNSGKWVIGADGSVTLYYLEPMQTFAGLVFPTKLTVTCLRDPTLIEEDTRRFFTWIP
jgi:hypothetical protein